MVYMLADRQVTTDELYAVGATFTLVAWAFAYVYIVLQLLVPGCFTAAVDPEAKRTWMELLFLSFTTPDQHRAVRRRADHPARPRGRR